MFSHSKLQMLMFLSSIKKNLFVKYHQTFDIMKKSLYKINETYGTKLLVHQNFKFAS